MLKEKVCIVTGAGGGIGACLSLKFGQSGARVALWDVNIPDELTQKLQKFGIPFIVDNVDITKSEDIKEGVAHVKEEWGRIDILVNNAGITRDNLVFRMKEDDWDAVIAVNLKGAFLCTKIVGRAMFSQKSGKIVNMASIIGQIGNLGQANYAASKAGLIAFTKTCAREFARAGINVNAIAPGYVKTKMTENLPVKVKEDMLSMIPLNRFADPEEVAELAIFLASEKANYITGQVVRIDGGLVM